MLIECVGICFIVYVCLTIVCSCNKNVQSIYYDEIEGEPIRSDC